MSVNDYYGDNTIKIFYIPSSKVPPVNINDSMRSRNSTSPGIKGVAMSQQDRKHWDIQMSCVQLSAPTWWLTMVCNSCFRGSNALF